MRVRHRRRHLQDTRRLRPQVTNPNSNPNPNPNPNLDPSPNPNPNPNLDPNPNPNLDPSPNQGALHAPEVVDVQLSAGSQPSAIMSARTGGLACGPAAAARPGRSLSCQLQA